MFLILKKLLLSGKITDTSFLSQLLFLRLMKPWTNWFEIPATDIARAIKFYETIFGMEIQFLDLGGLKMGMFPHKGIGAALCQHESYRPSETHGTLVYLDANPDLDEVLGRVEAAGGKIVRPKTQISPEYGYMAIFIDSEGNRMALNSNS